MVEIISMIMSICIDIIYYYAMFMIKAEFLLSWNCWFFSPFISCFYAYNYFIAVFKVISE